MLFGHSIAPGTFQRTMDVIIIAVKWQFALIDLDDIVVNFKSAKEQIGNVCRVLTLTNDTAVSLRVKKCMFFS